MGEVGKKRERGGGVDNLFFRYCSSKGFFLVKERLREEAEDVEEKMREKGKG